MDLDEGHARAVLLGRTSLAELQADVALAAAELSWISLEDADEDLDVPIPLILQVDAWARFRLAGDAGPAGGMLLDLRGEAYDRAYQLRLDVWSGERRGGDTVRAADWPASPAEALPAWRAGLAILSALAPGPLDEGALRRVLAASLPPALREVFQELALGALGPAD